jgi:glycosyltransferase involved in cell wall biosynthesis
MRWSPDDYVGPPSQPYVDRESARLAQPDVVHHAGLPNAEVLSLLRSCDFLVLPTLHDTFGYVSLEALAAGTPVIASATCAQPEIVEHGRCGFLLPLDRDAAVGKWPWVDRRDDPEYQGAYEAAIEQLAASLTEQLAAHWEARDGYTAMSQAALDRVRERFDRDHARRRLEELYGRMRSVARA